MSKKERKKKRKTTKKQPPSPTFSYFIWEPSTTSYCAGGWGGGVGCVGERGEEGWGVEGRGGGEVRDDNASYHSALPFSFLSSSSSLSPPFLPQTGNPPSPSPPPPHTPPTREPSRTLSVAYFGVCGLHCAADPVMLAPHVLPPPFPPHLPSFLPPPPPPLLRSLELSITQLRKLRHMPLGVQNIRQQKKACSQPASRKEDEAIEKREEEEEEEGEEEGSPSNASLSLSFPKPLWRHVTPTSTPQQAIACRTPPLTQPTKGEVRCLDDTEAGVGGRKLGGGGRACGR